MKYIILVVSLVFLAACSDAELTDKEYLEKAKVSIAGNKTRAAIIQLKNAIQKNPSNSEARQLLGAQYIIMGSAESAEKELGRAIELGVPKSKVMLDYGKAFLLQEKYKDLIRVANKFATQGEAEKQLANVLLGHAYLGLSDVDKAKAHFLNAQGTTSGNIPFLYIGLAKLSVISGVADDAVGYLEKITATQREYAEAQNMIGSIELSRGNPDKSISAFDRAVTAQGKDSLTVVMFDAHIGLARAYIQAKKLDKAGETVDFLLSKNTKHPMVNYLKGLVLFSDKQYKEALGYLEQVQKFAPDYAPGIFLLGSIHYALNNYEEANVHLTRFLGMVPTHLHARKLLALSRIGLNQTEGAMSALTPATRQANGADAETLTMIARVAAAAGEYNKGIKYINQINVTKENKNEISQELANLYYQKGSWDEAIDELEKISGENRSKAQASQVYIYMRKGDFVQARKIAESLLKADMSPKNFVLLGSVQMLAGEKDKARAEFNKALQMDPSYPYARYNLARMSLEDGKHLEAKVQFEKMLAVDKNNIKALLGMAQISDMTGNKEQAIQWVEKVRAIDKTHLPSRALLARYYLFKGDKEKALGIAKEAVNNTRNSLNAVRLLANVHVGRNETQKAINIYTDLLKRETKNPEILIELAVVYTKEKRFTEAKNALIKAQNINNKLINPKVALVLLEKEAGNTSVALKQTHKIKAEHPKSHIGYLLAGDILLGQKKTAKAIKEYNLGLAKTNDARFYGKLADAYGVSGKKAKSLEIMKQGQKAHPRNILIQQKLASAYMVNNDTQNAMKLYKSVISSQPKHLVALNNLANIMSMQGNKKGALEYSGRAYALAPENSAIADTHGWLLVETGDIAQGLDLLIKAAGKSQNPTIQYHYAVALYKSSKKTEATEILQKIKNSNFPEQKEVKKLLGLLTR